ncbi:MAG: hypothetical protein ACPG3U_00435 [Rhodothermales bacterium]
MKRFFSFFATALLMSTASSAGKTELSDNAVDLVDKCNKSTRKWTQID